MKKIYLFILASFWVIGASGQANDPALIYAKTIASEDLSKHLSVLASDAMQGRGTGEAGQKMAAAYIASHFQKIGLNGPVEDGENQGFYQNVELYNVSPGEVYIQSKDQRWDNDFKDMFFYGSGHQSSEVSENIVFVGSGSTEEFKSVEVKGKGVLAIHDRMGAWSEIVDRAKEEGAGMVYIVNAPNDKAFQQVASQWENYLNAGSLTLNKPTNQIQGVFFISPSVAAEIMNTDFEKLNNALGDASKFKKFIGKNIAYKVSQNTTVLNTENVLGYIEGSDKKEELIVLTAHYDHLGMEGEKIYNGADDDGSGTVAILEIAEAFIEAKRAGNGPRRSILFMTVTGEEKGLLGSAYYAENPIFPLNNTVANLNIDMIGRVDPKYKDNPNYVYLVGSNRLSSELHEISENVNSTYSQLELDYTYNDEDHPDRIYYRSDHWNFAKNNIPVIFYFNGIHQDYHQATDTVEKINFDMLKKRTKLVYFTAWELANRPNRVVVDK